MRLPVQVAAQAARQARQGAFGLLEHTPFVPADEDLASGLGEQHAVAPFVAVPVPGPQFGPSGCRDNDLVDDQGLEFLRSVERQRRPVALLGVEQAGRRIESGSTQRRDRFGEDDGVAVGQCGIDRVLRRPAIAPGKAQVCWEDAGEGGEVLAGSSAFDAHRLVCGGAVRQHGRQVVDVADSLQHGLVISATGEALKKDLLLAGLGGDNRADEWCRAVGIICGGQLGTEPGEAASAGRGPGVTEVGAAPGQEYQVDV